MLIKIRAQLVLLLAITLFCISVASAREAAVSIDKRPLALADMQSMHTPGAPQLSPDGSRIAFAIDDQLYLLAKSDSEARAITADDHSAYAPRWSADGHWLYFLSDRSGMNQVWKLPALMQGAAVQVTDSAFGIYSLLLSPDETRLLLVAAAEDLVEAEDSEEAEPVVIKRRQFKRDQDSAYITEAQISHLYALDIASGALRAITNDAFEETEPAWSPDGQAVVFVSNRSADAEAGYSNNLWLVPAGTATGDVSLTQLTNDGATKQAPAFRPDGKEIAFITAEDGVYGQQRLAVVPASGGEPRILTAALDRWVSAFQYSDDGAWIYFIYDDSGASHFARVRVRDAKIEPLISSDVATWAFHVRGKHVALNLNNANDLPDIYTLEGKKLQRRTISNAGFLQSVAVAPKTKHSFQGPDGTVVEAFITTPANYRAGQRYPTILNLHGGPVGQFAFGFDFGTQYYAARGYVVVEPNPRGSTGRGQAFIRAIYRTWGTTDYPDVIAAVDYAINAGLADPNRLAVTGYSYGGYLTNTVITRTTRFRAAASGAGHSLIAANFGHDMYQQWYSWELGPPWENRARYDSLSPLLRAGEVTTPTLFLGGELDWNVPLLNAELFYQSLRVNGVDAELVVYPGVHHGGWPQKFEMDYLQRVADWFDHYLDAQVSSK
ncbi:MAG TPA: S9 family peptidase [Woeseiaceae bacterium]|nr:S9 family peptidase [Woeseiaceae bacterium]